MQCDDIAKNLEVVQIRNATLHRGDCREKLKLLPDSSIDSIVTDPPYELGFMNRSWDASGIAYNVAMWRECLRVLKPGGHLLSFGGSRTYHRMACAIEDAGFAIRDQIQWIYGSGFPKSHNLDGDWEGWGTALKPAHEPIVVARKPLVGTVVENVLQHGTGALNIDGCRVPHDGSGRWGDGTRPGGFGDVGADKGSSTPNGRWSPRGRWPANVIHDGSEEVLASFPDAPGQSGAVTGNEPGRKTQNCYGEYNGKRNIAVPRGDTGSAARYFYCAKAPKADRDEGLSHGTKAVNDGRQTPIDNPYQRGETQRRNTHPTVKPTELMRYLCRLVTPPGGVVLDPFMGSGSTGKAAMREGFRFVGIEREAEFFAIAEARIRAVVGQPVRFEMPLLAVPDPEPEQISLFPAA